MNWGAVAIGAVAGLGGGAITAIVLLAAGVADTTTFGGQAALMLIAFATQVLAGYVAARFAGARARAALHGGLAGIAVFAVAGAVSIAAGTDPPIATLAFGAVVAVVLGTAGAVLAAATMAG